MTSGGTMFVLLIFFHSYHNYYELHGFECIRNLLKIIDAFQQSLYICNIYIFYMNEIE